MKQYFCLIIVLLFQVVNAQTTPITKVQNAKKATIIVYGSASCHFCLETKKQLTENKITFTFFDIDTDNTALDEMLSKLKKANISTKNLGIPVIDKEGEIFSNNTNFEDFLKKLLH